MSGVVQLRAPKGAETPAGLSRMLSTSTARKTTRWDDLLRMQVDLLLPQELDFYFASKDWQDAADILDAGCGNGYYLSRLHSFFARKRFHGVDISPQLVEIASRRPAVPGLSFAEGDFFALGGGARYDAVLMRFIVQHLRGFPAILAKAGEVLRPGGSLIIIEPDLANSGNYPPIPHFDEALALYNESAAGEHRLRGQLDALPGLVASIPGWELSADLRATSPRTGPFAGTNLQRVYMGWIDLWEQSGMFAYAFDKARHAVEEWSERSSTFSRIGLRFLSLRYLGLR